MFRMLALACAFALAAVPAFAPAIGPAIGPAMAQEVEIDDAAALRPGDHARSG